MDHYSTQILNYDCKCKNVGKHHVESVYSASRAKIPLLLEVTGSTYFYVISGIHQRQQLSVAIKQECQSLHGTERHLMRVVCIEVFQFKQCVCVVTIILLRFFILVSCVHRKCSTLPSVCIKGLQLILYIVSSFYLVYMKSLLYCVYTKSAYVLCVCEVRRCDLCM